VTSFAAVVTTIQPPTDSMRQMHAAIERLGGTLIVVGDQQGPPDYPLDGVQFLSLADQQASEFTVARLIPNNIYARKNVGYLTAIRQGASCIYETDDDNAPLPTFAKRSREVEAQPVTARPWFNVYGAFSELSLWPRGFPLDQIRLPETSAHDPHTPLTRCDAPIQQGLHDGSPDVDAVWRLVLEQEVQFDKRPSICLPPGTWSPFNSQSTWWWPTAYPLLYMPTHASAARMPDIWRSFVAQRCLWELGLGLVFHASEVFQLRNAHDYMNDFELELAGYLRNQELTERLAALTLEPGEPSIASNMRRCYACLIEAGFLAPEEQALIDGWLNDLRTAKGGRGGSVDRASLSRRAAGHE